ncbi:MAG: ABC transporter substrate-binding protein [Chitinophagaceae bacterium]
MKLPVKILLLFALFFFNTHNYAQPTKINLQLKWWHQFQFAGYYAAVNKGFYAEQGLNVNIVAGDKDHPPLEQVLSKKADFGVTGSDLIANYANGDPVKVIGAIFQHSPYVFISLKNKNITVATDLVGKTIMGSKDQGWLQLQEILIKEGISNKKVNLIEHSWKNEDLISGKTDVITGYISVEPFQIMQKGYAVNYIEPISYGIDFYGDVLFCTQQMAANNPELVKKFREASFKGWGYAMSHIDEMVQYILTLPGVQERGITKEILTYEANAMKKLIMPDLVEIGHMNEGRWQHILDIHKNFGLVSKKATIKDFIFNPEKEKNNIILKWIYYVIAPILLIIIIGILYTVSLKKAVKRRTIELEKEIAIRKNTEENLKISEERLELAATGCWYRQLGLEFNNQYNLL